MKTARAPATIGNVGPGFDVLGLCVDGLADTVSVSLGERDEVLAQTGRDAAKLPLDFAKNAAAIAASAVRNQLRPHAHLHLRIDKGLPASGGLGGSAASSVAGALATFALFDLTPTPEQLMLAALEGEAAVAGRHLDNIAPCVLGSLTIVVDALKPRVAKVAQPPPGWVALVTPNFELETKRARSVLPQEVPRAEFIHNMAASSALVLAFACGDARLLRDALHDHFAEPRRAPLIPNFEQAKKAALQAGALGSSISGAGPTTFALCETQAVAERAADAMVQAFGAVRLRHVGAIGSRGAEVIE